MSKWCEYCKDNSGFFSSSYLCTISGEDKSIPYNYVNNYCMYDYNVYNCPNYKKYGPSSGGCFITTIVCDILNKEDSCKVMMTLRNFRDNVLQKDKKYFEILKNYDVIGPVIAKKILNEENKSQMAKVIYVYELLPVVKLINEKKYNEAISSYSIMTKRLMHHYNLDGMCDVVEYDVTDATKLGHGKLIKKIKNA